MDKILSIAVNIAFLIYVFIMICEIKKEKEKEYTYLEDAEEKGYRECQRIVDSVEENLGKENFKLIIKDCIWEIYVVKGNVGFDIDYKNKIIKIRNTKNIHELARRLIYNQNGEW